MKISIVLLLLAFSAVAKTQTIDTTYLKESLGLRSKMTDFDSIIALRFLNRSAPGNCDCIDSILKSPALPRYPSVYSWGFSDEFKELITTRSIQSNKCIETVLNSIFQESVSRTLSNKDSPYLFFPVMNAIINLNSRDVEKLRSYFLSSGYQLPDDSTKNGLVRIQYTKLKNSILKFKEEDVKHLPIDRQKYLLTLNQQK